MTCAAVGDAEERLADKEPKYLGMRSLSVLCSHLNSCIQVQYIYNTAQCCSSILPTNYGGDSILLSQNQLIYGIANFGLPHQTKVVPN